MCSVVPRSVEGTTSGRLAWAARTPSGAEAGYAWAGAAARRGCLRCRCGGGVAAGPGGVEHVLLADAAADPRPGYFREVHAVLRGELADQRRDVRAVGAGRERRRVRVRVLAVGRGRRRLSGRCLRGRGGGPGARLALPRRCAAPPGCGPPAGGPWNGDGWYGAPWYGALWYGAPAGGACWYGAWAGGVTGGPWNWAAAGGALWVGTGACPAGACPAGA